MVAARPPVKVKGSGIKGCDPDRMMMKIKMKRQKKPQLCGSWKRDE